MTPTSPLYLLYLNTHKCTNPLCELPLTLKRLQNFKQESAKSVAFQLQQLQGEKPKTPWPPSLHSPTCSVLVKWRAPLPKHNPRHHCLTCNEQKHWKKIALPQRFCVKPLTT